MDIQKKKEKFQKRYDKASTGDTVKVVEFKRKHFKTELSTTQGFGYQDLKEDAKELYSWMISEKMDVNMVPTNMSPSEFSVLVTVKKSC